MTKPSADLTENKANCDDKKVEALPDYFVDNRSIVQFCHQQPDKLMNLTTNENYLKLLDGRSKKYISGKKSIMKFFFEIMATHDVFRHFCLLAPDPEFQEQEIPLFFIKLRGPKTEDKKYLLNQIMFWFAIKFKKQGTEKINLLDDNFTLEHANACYQPSTTESRLKELFAQFREHGILYSYKMDFLFSGGYANFFQTLWQKCKLLREDFGSLPFASTFDPDAEIKIRKNGNYDFKNNYNDCLELMIHNTLKLFQLRGGCEVRKNLFH